MKISSDKYLSWRNFVNLQQRISRAKYFNVFAYLRCGTPNKNETKSPFLSSIFMTFILLFNIAVENCKTHFFMMFILATT